MDVKLKMLFIDVEYRIVFSFFRKIEGFGMVSGRIEYRSVDVFE